MSAPDRSEAWRALVAPAAASVIALAILIGLGVWQLERLRWKTALIESIQARAFGPPVPPPAAPDWPSWSAAADEFRRLRVSGYYVPNATILLHGLAELRRGQAVPGVYMFTPLRQDDGSVTFVNRGFAAGQLRDLAQRFVEPESGRRTIVGIARAPETGGWFLPANDPARGEWFVRDLGEMARALGLGRVAPFYLAEPPQGSGEEPILGQTPISIPNNHLGYAFTWFGLAATLAGVFAAFAWRRLHPLPVPDPAGGAPAGPARLQGS